MKYLNSFSKYFLIFLTFLFCSRYLQRLIFDGDIQNSALTRIITGKDSCKPKLNSILNYAEQSKQRIVFLIIDAYPDTKIFNDLLKKDSKLHQYLIEKGTFLESKTLIPYTYKSLPFILGKIYPSYNSCRFPFFNGEIKPNMVLSSNLTGAHDGICAESFPSTNSFIRYGNKFRSYFLYPIQIYSPDMHCA